MLDEVKKDLHLGGWSLVDRSDLHGGFPLQVAICSIHDGSNLFIYMEVKVMRTDPEDWSPADASHVQLTSFAFARSARRRLLQSTAGWYHSWRVKSVSFATRNE